LTSKETEVKAQENQQAINSSPEYLRKFIQKKIEEAEREEARKKLTLLDGNPVSAKHEML
jgi:hypothetical protein